MNISTKVLKKLPTGKLFKESIGDQGQPVLIWEWLDWESPYQMKRLSMFDARTGDYLSELDYDEIL